MRHTFLVVTVKRWLKSVYIYGSYRKIKTGVPLFLDHSVYTGMERISFIDMHTGITIALKLALAEIIQERKELLIQQSEEFRMIIKSQYLERYHFPVDHAVLLFLQVQGVL